MIAWVPNIGETTKFREIDVLYTGKILAVVQNAHLKIPILPSKLIGSFLQITAIIKKYLRDPIVITFCDLRMEILIH